MSSIVEGYEYDIFISYRQNDNHSDKWVTNFVNALKEELEATLKNPVSIYFDENPHDGLLETHQVDASLAKKLKCLVFIPIVSQTYCDPYCFAWEQEFIPFIEMVKEDELGMNITVSNGNVTSRVLPIKIHELDTEDQYTLEAVLDGPLRSIDFIYQEPGVNRPLRPNDSEEKNLNKTRYRNQINKVANALKELNASLSNQKNNVTNNSELGIKSKKSESRNILFIVGVILLAVVIGVLYFLFNYKTIDINNLEKSIAVLPFYYYNSDESATNLGEAFSNEMITELCKIKGFDKVISHTSTLQYIGNDRPSIPIIGKELNANFIIEGSLERQFDNVSINIQVIQSADDNHIWAEEFRGKWSDIFKLRAEICKEVASTLKTILTQEDLHQLNKTPTESIDAYDLYLLGNNYLNNFSAYGDIWKAIEYFEKAIFTDTLYAQSYIGLARAHYALVNYGIISPIEGYPEVKKNSLKALSIDNELGEAHTLLGIVKWGYEYKLDAAGNEFKRAVEVDPNCSFCQITYANYLKSICKMEDAKLHANKSIILDPLSKTSMNVKANLLPRKDRIKLLEDYCKSDPNQHIWYWYLALNHLANEDYDKTISTLLTQIDIMGDDNISDEIAYLGYSYGKLGNLEMAMQQLDRLDSLSDKGHYISPRTTLQIYIGIGDFDNVANIMEESYKNHSISPVTFISPYFESQKDPRFRVFLVKLGYDMECIDKKSP
ncbi:MAG: hypothetical protein ABFS32_13805 [Bacteroidota bacterium]